MNVRFVKYPKLFLFYYQLPISSIAMMRLVDFIKLNADEIRAENTDFPVAFLVDYIYWFIILCIHSDVEIIRMNSVWWKAIQSLNIIHSIQIVCNWLDWSFERNLQKW